MFIRRTKLLRNVIALISTHLGFPVLTASFIHIYILPVHPLLCGGGWGWVILKVASSWANIFTHTWRDRGGLGWFRSHLFPADYFMS